MLTHTRIGRTTFAALGERDYSWFLAGNVTFFTAFSMNLVVRGFLVFDLTGSATAIGLVSVGQALPVIFLAPLGGVVADRVSKRALLAVCETLDALTIATVAVLVLTGTVAVWHLFVTALIVGSLSAVIIPARQAMAPQLVPRHLLQNAISLQMGGQSLTQIAGPALGGLLIAPLGLGWVYVWIAVLILATAASEARLPAHGMVAVRTRAPFRSDLQAGIRYVRGAPLIRLLILTGMLMPLFAMPVQQVLPVFIDEVYGRGPGALGLLAASGGVGGIVGALLAANLGHVTQKGRLMLLAGLAMSGSFLLFALMDGYWLALTFLALATVGNVLFLTVNNTVIQSTVPSELRGRVMAFVMMSFGLTPLGVLPVAVAADAVGPQAAVAGATVVLMGLILAFFLASSRLRNLRLGALAEAALSPVQAAKLVAEGRLTQAEADRLTRSRDAGLAAPAEHIAPPAVPGPSA